MSLLALDCVLALDIGGANLKAADGLNWADSQPFPLWQHPHALAARLAEMIARAPAAPLLAVTMTGELADCYATKAEGVCAILDAVESASCSGQSSAPVKVLVYQVTGEFVTPAVARSTPLATAASNWHALARLAARQLPSEPGLLIDIGSTTTDIVPIRQGEVAARALNDPERLAAGELCYTGVIRSPVCAVSRDIPWRGGRCPLAQELFATMHDVHLLIGQLPEDPRATDTADGRAATFELSRDRLARAICADRTLFSQEDAVTAAHWLAEEQLRLLTQSLLRVVHAMEEEPRAVVTSGAGEFLARRLVHSALPHAETVSLTEKLGAAVSQVAPAHAVAVLAREWLT